MNTVSNAKAKKPFQGVLIGQKVLYYNFENNAAIDQWNAKNGTVSGSSITTTSPKFGQYSFQGDGVSTTKFVSVPALAITTNGLSISLWVRTIAAPVGGDAKVFELTAEGLMMWSSATLNRYNFANGTMFTMAPDVYHHVVITLTSANVAMIYVDKVNVVTQTLSNVYPPFTGIAAGGKIGSSISSAHRPINGCVDDFRIYNKILSTTEIDALYLNIAI